MDLSVLLTPPSAFHPIVVHFAIALTLFGVGLDVAAFRFGRSAWHAAARLCLAWGVVAMLVAACVGWFDHERLHAAASHSHGGGELMELHETLGWTLVVVFGALSLLRWRAGERVSRPLVGLLAFASLGILVQGHIGGTLVFGQGLGVAEHSAAPDESAGMVDSDHSLERAEGHSHAGHAH